MTEAGNRGTLFVVPFCAPHPRQPRELSTPAALLGQREEGGRG